MNKETNNYLKPNNTAGSDFIRDRAELANAPYPGKIPAWWLLEGTPEQIAEWQRMLDTGEATLDR